MVGDGRRRGKPPGEATPLHELSTLLRFSLLFNLSTLFLCIFSAIFSYLSFSSLAALLSLMAWIRCFIGDIRIFFDQQIPSILVGGDSGYPCAHLSLRLLLILHLLLFGLDRRQGDPLLCPLLVGRQAGAGSEGLAGRMPLLPCKRENTFISVRCASLGLTGGKSATSKHCWRRFECETIYRFSSCPMAWAEYSPQPRVKTFSLYFPFPFSFLFRRPIRLRK